MLILFNSHENYLVLVDHIWFMKSFKDILTCGDLTESMQLWGKFVGFEVDGYLNNLGVSQLTGKGNKRYIKNTFLQSDTNKNLGGGM